MLRAGVPVRRLDRARARCLDAYDRVEQLPRGAGRSAAWAAYALVTYGDKIVAAVERDGCLDGDTARIALASFELAERSLQGAPPERLPRWQGGSRSEEQLRGMRDALDALQTFLAFELRAAPGGALLARVDASLAKVARLWIARPTEELRGGIAGALVNGLDEAYALGRAICEG